MLNLAQIAHQFDSYGNVFAYQTVRAGIHALRHPIGATGTLLAAFAESQLGDVLEFIPRGQRDNVIYVDFHRRRRHWSSGDSRRV